VPDGWLLVWILPGLTGEIFLASFVLDDASALANLAFASRAIR